jgi:hypothetical protein
MHSFVVFARSRVTSKATDEAEVNKENNRRRKRRAMSE